MPILVGRPEVVAARIEREGLSLQPGEAFDLVNPESDERYRDYWGSYHAIMSRRGVSPDLAKAILRTNSTAIAAAMLRCGEVDSLICGLVGACSCPYRDAGRHRAGAVEHLGLGGDAGRELRLSVRRRPGGPRVRPGGAAFSNF